MRRHFAEVTGLVFIASILLAFLLLVRGGTALLLGIALVASAIGGTVWQRRRELRRGRI